MPKKKLAFKTVYHSKSYDRKREFMVIASEAYGHEIVCMNNVLCEKELTMGKKYICHKTGTKLLYVVNDKGDRRGYRAARFNVE